MGMNKDNLETLRIARIRANDARILLKAIDGMCLTREISTLNELIEDLDAICQFQDRIAASKPKGEV
jgi:hypothetical protein